MRTITLVKDAKKLPVGTIITTQEGGRWEKTSSNNWTVLNAKVPFYPDLTNGELIRHSDYPLTIDQEA